MVDFLHYGLKRPAINPVSSKPIVQETTEEIPQVVVAETTAPVMEEEKITVTEQDTVQTVVEKVKKSKKLHAKVEEGGKKVRVKRILKD